jgi:hypothetical protein
MYEKLIVALILDKSPALMKRLLNVFTRAQVHIFAT